MIAGILHEGSGLGDQLFRYITVRTLAEEKGFDWYMKGEFKGQEFMPLLRVGGDKKEGLPFNMGSWNEKDVRDAQRNDIRSYDPEINFVEDNTVIDGSFEDSKYWAHNLDNISKWLAVEPLNVPEDKVVIGFRGGEYASQPDLFLPPSYWKEAMKIMGSLITERSGKGYSIYNFEVHTDDPEMAKAVLTEATKSDLAGMSVVKIIENAPISHSKHTNMGFNWRSARYAKYAIVPNSAFFILPRLLKHHEDPTAVTIAPRYWARRNTKIWARPACYYKQFTYI